MPKLLAYNFGEACFIKWPSDSTADNYTSETPEDLSEEIYKHSRQSCIVLLKCVHWPCVENIPLSKFKSLKTLLHDLGLQDVALLKQTAIQYHSYLLCFKIERLYFNFCTPYTALLLKKLTSVQGSVKVWAPVILYYSTHWLLDWDSWFFMKCVPGLTIANCNKITA